MAIKDSDGVIIPSNVSQLESGSAKFLVTFQPTSLGTHTVNITFNKEVLKGWSQIGGLKKKVYNLKNQS